MKIWSILTQDIRIPTKPSILSTWPSVAYFLGQSTIPAHRILSKLNALGDLSTLVYYLHLLGLPTRVQIVLDLYLLPNHAQRASTILSIQYPFHLSNLHGLLLALIYVYVLADSLLLLWPCVRPLLPLRWWWGRWGIAFEGFEAGDDAATFSCVLRCLLILDVALVATFLAILYAGPCGPSPTIHATPFFSVLTWQSLSLSIHHRI